MFSETSFLYFILFLSCDVLQSVTRWSLLWEILNPHQTPKMRKIDITSKYINNIARLNNVINLPWSLFVWSKYKI